MDSSNSKPLAEVAQDVSPMFKIYEDGRVERLVGNEIVPPSFDPKTSVDSKDIVYSPENNLSARLYIPKNTNNPKHKLPLVVYIYGGGFCIYSAFHPIYHNYVNTLVSEAKVIAVSVDHRRAPENPVPCAHEDSWAALKWVASHADGQGPEDWLNHYADFERVFIYGDSVGGNIAHHMVMRLPREILDGFNVVGIVLAHTYFWGKEPIGDETIDAETRAPIEKMWRAACPGTSGCDDPLINPFIGSSLANLGCKRVQVHVAEKDLMRDRGWFYYEKLKESGWGGEAKIIESKGEPHIFYLLGPTCDSAVAMRNKIASFFNEI
ncbi:hypothetical protein AB3S75_043383 [Citrus x aurantiifolia]